MVDDRLKTVGANHRILKDCIVLVPLPDTTHHHLLLLASTFALIVVETLVDLNDGFLVHVVGGVVLGLVLGVKV